WLIKNGRKPFYTIVPMFFMLVMTVWSLVNMVTVFVSSVVRHGTISTDVLISGICGIVLLALTLMLLFEAAKCLLFLGCEKRRQGVISAKMETL
ncbi:MAG TPA: hypothetical protein PLU24_03475, partial [Candidatus Omnitrophota bacterium]|nr:hypothetical protein [Candidatus Omnitrophota bacterium]